jgi:hypothetical protein
MSLSHAGTKLFLSFPSAAFELVKVRRQLEYSIAQSKGIVLVKPPNTLAAVGEIFKANGVSGLFTGFPLHFCEISLSYAPPDFTNLTYVLVRDTAGTAVGLNMPSVSNILMLNFLALFPRV